MAETGAWYQRLYGADPELRQTRDNYAMKENTLPDPARRADLVDFFFWTAWASATDRPGYHATYTNNWPPEPLIGNHPTAENIMWSLACVIIMLAGIGLLIWGWAFLRSHDPEPQAPANDPGLAVGLTPSQKAPGRSEARRVGKEGVRTGRSGWAP